jgi:YYY domain-containing protein
MSVLTFCCWLALVWGAGWLFFPLSRRIFGDTLPDGGLQVGRVLFLALWTLAAFWTGHAGVPTRISAYAWLLLGALGLALALHDKAALRAEIKSRHRAIVSGEAIFLLVFLGFFALRGFWSDTDGTNGEKSMDSALIGSLTRAQRLPPPNPYAAGSDLRGYYYFGHLETALLTNATGTTVRWSYNFMCATLPALCFATLFSLGAALTQRLRGGAFVSLGVLGLGTLQPIIQWKNQHSFGASTPLRLDHFATSRVIPFTINEYPWFTFNQADLHAHYFDFPFALATLCLAYALFRGQKLALIPAVMVLGVQVMTNTWDFPAYGIVLGLAVCGGWLSRSQEKAKVQAPLPLPPDISTSGSRSWGRYATALAMLFGALLVAAPYLLNLKTAANPPRPLAQPASPLREWLALWGPYAGAWFLFASYTLLKTRLQRGVCLGICLSVLLVSTRGSWFAADMTTYQPSRLVLPLILTSLAIAIWGAWKLRDQRRFLCFLAVGGLVALLWSETTWAGFLGDPSHVGFDDYKRQDTVFKFGLQTWMLWGIAVWCGAYLTLKKWPEVLVCAFIMMIPIMVISSLAATFGRAHNFLAWTNQGAWIGWQHLSPSDPFRRDNNLVAWDGWDGWAHLAAPEKEAATWLEQHTPPGQNLLEAESGPGGDYSNFTRYAHATGIPTVIGPQAHSFQWSPANSGNAGREWDDVFRRKALVRAFFTQNDPTTRREMLQLYKVRYIVCGELERNEYGQGVLDSLRSTCPEIAHFGQTTDPHQVWIFAAPGT